jgi:cyclopropane-fatty-acyl-phospholipid synthase
LRASIDRACACACGLAKEVLVRPDIPQLVALLKQRAAERQLSLNLELWNGRHESFGPAPAVTLKLNRPEAVWRLRKPDLDALGRAYVEGEIDVLGPADEAVRVAVALARGATGRRLLPRPDWAFARHSLASDARAISLHYDVSNDFYRLWLDRAMVYSCAYFRHGDETLDRAQEEKLDLICRKLQLRPGDRLLDIGCGWGALILWAQRHYGVNAVGVTLSQRQFDHVRQVIAERGLAGEVEVRLQDYRQIPGEGVFDKISSVGMFEHVGLKNLPTYFGTIHRLLANNGLVLNHGITNRAEASDGVRASGSAFIERYVFPGGELPELAHAMAVMAGQHLEVFDVEGLRPHYARTLTHWVARLEAGREEALRLVGEKAYRTWRIYMAGSAHAFEQGWISVHQMLAAKSAGPGFSAQPWNRDHMLRAAPSAETQSAAPAQPPCEPALAEMAK